MTKRICKTYEARLKAQVALEAYLGKKELIEISTEHKISKTTICEWRDKLINEAVEIFIPSYEKDKQVKQLKETIESLHKIIGELTIENSFLKKKITELDRTTRMHMLDPNDLQLSIRRQVALLCVCRSSVYYKPLLCKTGEIANFIKEIYLDSDCRYGYRKITAELTYQGYTINHKKVLRLMQDMGIQGLYPRRFKNTSLAVNHTIYPYLLEGLAITQPNQVWVTDITYIALQNRFMYFIAIMDLYSRYIVAYELSSNLETGFCVDTLKVALTLAIPMIFNTDQGAQFTSLEFIKVLNQYNIQISMDHKGRCFDNIFAERLWRTLKQESIYYYRPETVKDLETCLKNFVAWYNHHRLHQSLNYQTPAAVYGRKK